jgi:hypothetical protein
MEEGQTTQWPKENGQNDNNDLQNTTQILKDQATRITTLFLATIYIFSSKKHDFFHNFPKILITCRFPTSVQVRVLGLKHHF